MVWVPLGVLVVGLLAGGVLVGLYIYVNRENYSPYRPPMVEDRKPVGCDELLKLEIIVDRDVDISEGMSRWVGAIQAENDHCAPEIWNPEIDGGRDPYGRVAPHVDHIIRQEAGFGLDPVTECFDLTQTGVRARYMVGGRTVPGGLRDGSLGPYVTRETSGRDSSNNVIIYWSAYPGRRPLDGSGCWLFVARYSAWSNSR